METKTETAEQRISRWAAQHGVTLTSVFVPFSQSRNAKPKEDGKVWKSLNWRVTVKANGRDIVTTDYSAGVAHVPGYKQGRETVERREIVEHAIEHGRVKATAHSMFSKPLPGPSLADVLSSLALDADVIDYRSFEDWASEFGYDEDSRKAEATYRACLETALALRNGLGAEVLDQLQTIAREY